jgi:Arc/MetJ-type ribon-helix-helix transcriptional regulator
VKRFTTLSNRKKENSLKALRNALIEGEDSGWVQNFDTVDFKNKLKKKFFSKRLIISCLSINFGRI